VDFTGSFPTSQDNKGILVAVDYISKWVEAIASPANDSQVVVRLFKNAIFPSFRVPRVLISNNGAHCIEKKLNALLKKYEVHRKYGLSYHPQMSGQMEISNRKIKIILEKMVVRSRKG